MISELEKAGFVDRAGKGGHRKFFHPELSIPVVVSGKLGEDAKNYQEKAVKRAIREVRE